MPKLTLEDGSLIQIPARETHLLDRDSRFIAERLNPDTNGWERIVCSDRLDQAEGAYRTRGHREITRLIVVLDQTT